MSDIPSAPPSFATPSIEETIARVPYIAKDYQSVFANNIKAFQDYIPAIAEAFAHYQPEKFELVATDFSVDLVTKGTDELVFGGDAFRTSLMDFEYFKRSPQTTNFSVKRGKHENIANFIHLDFLEKFIALEKKYETSISKEAFFPEALGMLICFGLGTGFYLENLISTHEVNRIYIYEPNHDFFYASLHLIDWHYILTTLDEKGGSLHLSLGGDEEVFFADLGSDLFRKGRYDISKAFVYEHYLDEKISNAVKLFKLKSYELVYGFGFFDDALMAVAHHYHNLRTSPAIAVKEPLTCNATVPVFICGNGPSLDKNMALIKNHADRAIIVSCGTTIDSLLRNGILPDFHVEQERTRPVHDRLLSVDKSLLKKIPFLSINTVSPEVFGLFERRMVGLKADEPSTLLTRSLSHLGTSIKRVAYCNPTVANCALTLVEALGFREFYFIGTDLGFPFGQHHSKDSIYYKEDGEDKALFDLKDQNHLELPGNFGGSVRTSSAFGYSAQSLTAFITRSPHINCFNLSDGVFVEGAQPLEPHLLELGTSAIDKKEIVDRCFDYYHRDCIDLAIEFEQGLSQLNFDEFIDGLIEITYEPQVTRFDALTNLYRQYIYLESGGEQESLYFRDMIRGSILYTHTILSRILQSIEDPEIAVKVNLEGLEILRDYLEAIKTKYHQKLLHADTTEMLSEWRDKTIFKVDE
ncbi:6-hydroxymethylpterin diphosphokinase MptE-like protein [Motilimonas sp. E26]|uniref:motility associated factor glycosyltransferase family protein n=1 Tax=Motilimonas sp. E26 TaxID=2865674 RepID=UPI001E323585|nr:6-hydroxymethylpterin diphosphokinase MptE-like protein [Motilimonas sp. E26]MCE0556212.1 DUF115 domain-containing protein [Motilimonas sp. E26]